MLFDETTAENPYMQSEKAEEWDALRNRGAASDDLAPLKLCDRDTLVDVGCGSGYHTVEASRRCGRVHGVDVSPAMIAITKRNAQLAGQLNVECHQNGFLSADFRAMHPTKAFSWGALHHLPDAWKGLAFCRIADALPTGGMFMLMDLVYSCSPRELVERQAAYVQEVSKLHGPEVADDLAGSLVHEFPTYNRVIRQLASEAGFEVVEEASLPSGCWSNFLCRRVQ